MPAELRGHRLRHHRTPSSAPTHAWPRASLRLASGDLLGASINRSPEAYLRQPRRVRARPLPDDVDNADDAAAADGARTGASWASSTGSPCTPRPWATTTRSSAATTRGSRRPTSSREGRARRHRSPDTFVAAFAQQNEGDVTPNICGGTNGGGANDFEDTALSAPKQYDFAGSCGPPPDAALMGGVDYRHAYVKMDAVDVAPAFTDGEARRTCPAAIGAVHAGGRGGRAGLRRGGRHVRERARPVGPVRLRRRRPRPARGRSPSSWRWAA